MSKVHEIVTEKILAALDKGVVPWVRPWATKACFNAKGGRAYRGMNALLLDMSGRGPGFLTPKAAMELGGNFKGVKSELVVFYAPIPVSKKKIAAGEADPDDTFFMLRYYNVIPVSEIEGLPQSVYDKNKASVQEHKPVEEAEAIIKRFIEKTGVKFQEGGNKACYFPLSDEIHVPPRNAFTSIEEYYCSIFHEMVHATQREDRCNVKDNYALNELRAEIGAALLLSQIGLDASAVMNNAAAYCSHWADQIRGEKNTLIVQAASKAYGAADYILGESEEESLALAA